MRQLLFPSSINKSQRKIQVTKLHQFSLLQNTPLLSKSLCLLYKKLQICKNVGFEQLARSYGSASFLNLFTLNSDKADVGTIHSKKSLCFVLPINGTGRMALYHVECAWDPAYTARAETSNVCRRS